LAPLELGARQAQTLRAMTLALFGRCHEAQQIRAQFGQVGRADDYSGVFNLACLLEVSTRCHDEETAARLRSEALAVGWPIVESRQLWPTSWPGRGNAGPKRRGRIAFAGRTGDLPQGPVQPELALIHLELAELMLNGNPNAGAKAVGHLDLAIPELSAMHMQPSLEGAQQLAAIAARENKAVGQVAHAIQRQSEKSAEEEGVSHNNTSTLTARERDVARLVSSGLSNRDIAERLVISETTVEVHIKHILSKLQFKSTSQVAVWALQNGLL
jgi:DNA-binding CsgD family transcriptional regulator